ncbi:hypothetical protein P7C71_g3198, partial [Lecanoromycetidae sp. Uapishka_2]
MSLLLAPYNNAMRLGMGFNSYTQTLCVNDVVQKPDGVKASDEDLRPTSLSGDTKAEVASTVNGTANSGALTSNSGTTVITRTEGQTLVSQTVTWEAKFVDKISEVTDSMNISGSLAIKVDAIGGGGAAEGHFIDSNKFKESDINYMIQVKVTNQKLIADDVTQFVPIRNVQPGDFTAVYGDSYISGFLEGGIFNALVSVKLKDKSAVKDFGGGLKVDLGFTGVSVSGEAKGGKRTEDNSNDRETTISAILTKYTGLRSFYEQNLKGSPLDYENAGVYASALLDAYMVSIWEVDNGISSVKAQESTSDLVELAKLAEDDYEMRLAKYKDAVQSDDKKGTKTIAASSIASRGTEDEPLKPNKLVPYKASVYGLDQAKRDCRFEMIKIVREVVTNIKAEDQKDDVNLLKKQLEATQKDRDSNKDLKNKAEKALAVATNERDAAKSAAENAEKNLNATSSQIEQQKADAKAKDDKLATLQKELDAARRAVRDHGNSGILVGVEKGWKAGKDSSALIRQEFPTTLSQPPRILYGLSGIDVERNGRLGVACDPKDLSVTGFTVEPRSFGGSQAYGINFSWLTLPNNGVHFEFGQLDTYSLTNFNKLSTTQRIEFPNAFKSPPKVLAWFYEINKIGDWCSLKTYPKDASSTGFNIVIESWANRPFDGARVCWLAYEAEEDGKRVKSDKNLVDRATKFAKQDAPWYGTPFTQKPAVFIGISELDFSMGRNIRVRANIDGATNERLQWSYGTWDDSDMDHLIVTWLAVEPQ